MAVTAKDKKGISKNVETIKHLERIFEVFKASEAEIRPHFVLTGSSGSGKTHTISQLVEKYELNLLEINAAQLTKEGTSGNSLSKALSSLMNNKGLTVVFVDEFDKLFISGNSNSSLAHETTNGVQNEFLRVLESNLSQVYGDYGKYVSVPVDKCLFIFAGAFNGEEDITLDRLRDFGIKTEFLGRVGLVYALSQLTLDDLKHILSNSPLLKNYLHLFSGVKREDAIKTIMEEVEANYALNTLGVRILSNMIHTYFIHGGLSKSITEERTFQKKLTFGE